MNLALILQKPLRQSKSRLKICLTEEERTGLVRAMLFDVLSRLSKSRSVDRIGIISRDLSAIGLARLFGASVFYENQVLGMNPAIKKVISTLGSEIKRVIIVPSDIPFLMSSEVDQLMNQRGAEVTIIPCYKQCGTNGLILSPPNIMETAFGSQSMKKHCQIAGSQGLTYILEKTCSLSYDIDTWEDLLLFNKMGEGTESGKFLQRVKVLKNWNGTELRYEQILSFRD